MANAIAVPLTGWLSQRFGQVRLFAASVVLFVIASWLCGLAPNMTTLIVFRVLQGLVAGPMIPLSQSLLLSSYPKALAGLAMAMWAMTTLVAPVAGPLLGGWITDNISWPWIFYINIPVGLVAAFASPGRSTASATRRASACRSTPSASRCSWSGSARCRSCSTRARISTGSIPARSSRWPFGGGVPVLPSPGS